MAGYTRQSDTTIQPNEIVKAAPINAEYNAIRDAFAVATGHRHDGSSSEGAYIPVISDSDNFNKVVVDPINNRVSFYIEVGGAAVEQVRVQDGAIVPVTDNDIDLGASGLKFKNLYVDGIGEIGSVTILGGTINNTVIGGTTPAAADFTTMDTTGNASVGGTFAVTSTSTFTGAMSAGSLTTTGNSTHATVDINGGAIDGTIIGASSAAAGSFTTVSTSGQATLATADINGGTIDGSVIGGTTAQAITGTTVTANTGFTGALTGNVTGNVTGNLTGDVTGDVTGDLTGNVTASTGTTTLNDLVVNGTVDFTSTALLNVSDPTAPQHAATKIYTDTADALKLNLAGGTMSGDITMGGNTVTGLGTPSADSDAATKGFVDTSIANVIDAAPASLDTLNELAAALGDDANFSTTVLTSLANRLSIFGGDVYGDIRLGSYKATSTATPATPDTLTRKGYVDTQDALKLDLTGGTMSGAISMGTSKITGLGDPTAAQDAATKTYVDTADATKLNLSGGTVTGAIDMGANKITTTYTPTDNADLTTKTYVDGILGSATAASASAAAAATSETNAATSETNAGNSAAAAAASYDDFDDRYLGAKSSAPTVDNDGDALVTGALYWDTTSNELYVWSGSAWTQGAFTVGSLLSNVVEDTTPQLGGNLDSNGNDITFGQDDKAIFGGVHNLQLYNDGVNSIIGISNTHTGKISNITDDETFITFTPNNSVEIYHDNDVKLTTTTTGVNIRGDANFFDNDKAIFGTGGELQVYNDGTTSLITSTDELKFQRTNTSSFIPTFTFEAVNNSFIGPFISLKHDTTSPGNTDYALITHDSKNDAAQDVTYSQIFLSTSDVTDGSEKGIITFKTKDSGADKTLLVLNSTHADVEIGDDGAVLLANGTTAQRPSTGQNGMLRYNTDDAQFEGYADGEWGAIAGGGGDTQTVTTTSTTQTALGSYAAATSLGIEITVIATDTVATERTITKLLVTHDGTTAVATQYGEVNTATAVAAYDVDISGSNVRLLATAASANSTNFTAVATILA
jgi:hypothetical protein